MINWITTRIAHAPLIALAACALFGTGCYKATFVDDPTAVAGEEHDPWTGHFLWGLAGHEHVDVREYCPDGKVQSVRTGGNVGTWAVSGVTLGIYSPRKVYITCSAGSKTADGRGAVHASATKKEVVQ